MYMYRHVYLYFSPLILLLQVAVNESRPSCVKDQLSLHSSSLHLRSHHSGEVAGMVAAASLMTGAAPGNAGEVMARLTAVFTSQLRDALREGEEIERDFF